MLAKIICFIYVDSPKTGSMGLGYVR